MLIRLNKCKVRFKNIISIKKTNTGLRKIHEISKIQIRIDDIQIGRESVRIKLFSFLF